MSLAGSMRGKRLEAWATSVPGISSPQPATSPGRFILAGSSDWPNWDSMAWASAGVTGLSTHRFAAVMSGTGAYRMRLPQGANNRTMTVIGTRDIGADLRVVAPGPADLVVELGGEGAFADPGGVGLDDAQHIAGRARPKA